MKTITQSDLKSVMLFDCEVRVALDASQNILYCADDIFSSIFGNDKYSHLKLISNNSEPSASFELGRKSYDFYPIEVINSRFLEYDVPENIFRDKSEKYQKYIEFISSGGCNKLVDYACIAFSLDCKKSLLNKNIDNLIGLTINQNPEHRSELPDDISNVLSSKDKEIEELKEKLLEASLSIENLYSEVQEYDSLLRQKDQEKDSSLALEIEELSKEISSYKDRERKRSINSFKEFIKDEKTRFWASVAAIVIFLPFTVMALREYIAIPTDTVFGNIVVYILCTFIASAWDFSILMFSENGAKRLSLMGSIFQFIFISAKFNFFAYWITDLTGADGAYWQKMIVITAICIYSPVVVNQFTALADKKDPKE